MLYNHLQNWLLSGWEHSPHQDRRDILEALVTGSEADYIRAQGEALAWLEWLKKFARAFLKNAEPAGDGEVAMPRPLPECRNIADPFAGAPNHGLVWGKFFDRWANDHAEPPGGSEKQHWIKKFCRKLGDEGTLSAVCDRQKKLARALGGTTEAFTTTAPFITGTGLEHPVENGFAFHHTLGLPYLPGSSVKGLIRAWAEHWQGEKAHEIDRIFGSPADDGGIGNVIVFDALPIAPLSLMAEVLTPP